MPTLNLELIDTPTLIEELHRRFPNVVLVGDRQATTDDERTYFVTPNGDPWRCLYLANRAVHVLNRALDAHETDDPDL